MDPALFHIDWAVLSELLITIIVLSFFIERALSLVFEHRLYVSRLDQKGLKEPIAFIVSLAIVWGGLQFDALAVLFRLDTPNVWGYVVTAAIIAGGSKASIALFHDLMNVRSSAAKAKPGAGASSGSSVKAGGAGRKKRP